MTKAPWSDRSMALAERDRRALVTVIAGHVAIVLPKSLAGTTEQDLAQAINRIVRALEEEPG